MARAGIELSCLVLVVLLLAWNSITLLDLRTRMSGHDEALNELISSRLEEIGSKLDGLLSKQSESIQQSCKRNSESIKSEISLLTPQVKTLVENVCGTVSADVGKHTSTLLEAMLPKSMPQQDKSCNLESKLDAIEEKFGGISTHIDTMHTIITGRDNAEGLRAAYHKHAYETMLTRHGEQVYQKMRATSSRKRGAGTAKLGPIDHKLSEYKPGDMLAAHTGKVKTVQSKQRRQLRSLPNVDAHMPSVNSTILGQDTEMLIVLPTFLRPKLEVNTEYIRKVVASLSAQYKADLLDRKITLLVVNNSPKTHLGVANAIEEVLQDTGSTLEYHVETGFTEFDDPFGKDLHLKVDLPGKPDLLESWEPSRKHCRHLVETLSKVAAHPAKYVLLWEDDMLMCGSTTHGTLRSIFTMIDTANAYGADWTGLRVGFGGNGLIFHYNDVPIISDYVLANMHRKPPDWLLTEWYKGLTYSARMGIGSRHRGYTHRLNLFEHIGNHSSFPDRENQGSKDSNSHVQYEIPKCMEENWWLLPAERFRPQCKAHDISPCAA
eukprot:m.977014 g.977014  ORF g.977014 m.977014 type:complete len:549 (+) comp23949_c1_seq6:267-1913(+)